MAQTATETRPPTSAGLYDVLTLEEAAAYLRVAETDVLNLVQRRVLPGRRVGEQWRFLRAALQDWLRTPDQSDFWQRHFGALKGDPYLDEMLEKIYQERGRPMTEEG
jgi:excisionase family DNA binding protein